MTQCILFFDIDGTILSERTHIISEDTKSAIEQARSNGHLVFINTGRTIAELDSQLLSLKVDGFVCGCGTYITYRNQILLDSEIPKELQKSVHEDILHYNLEACLEGTDFVYISEHVENLQLRQIRERMVQNKISLKDLHTSSVSFSKFTIWEKNTDNFMNFYQKYKEVFTFIDRRSLYEVVPLHFSKATGIEYLLRNFSIPLKNAFAFGDSANDLSMLEYVPNSIAMGNATKEVKDKVAFITKDVDDNGISFALKHLNLI